jgi:hypothetical protein
VAEGANLAVMEMSPPPPLGSLSLNASKKLTMPSKKKRAGADGG